MWTEKFQIFKLVLEKAEEPEIKLPTSTGSSKRQENSRKTSTSASKTMLKALDYMDHDKLWKIIKAVGIPDHLPCLLRNLYAGQEETVKSKFGTMGWCQIGKGVYQGPILSPCLFSFCAECIIWNTGLDESQAGIKIAGRNINNLKYVDDITLMVESEEEIKTLLMKVKEESEKAGLKLNIQKFTSWHFIANRWSNNGNSDRLFSWSLKSL